jgi:penicillin-binding protein 1A
MKRLYNLFKFFFYAFVVCSILGLGGVLAIFHHFSKDLPKLASLKDYNPPVISEVFADDGTKVGEFWIERRTLLSPQEIPKIVEQAIIAGEDKSFFEHSGIDYFGIFRAMVENLKAGQIVQGGSTITQQVVKSFLLTNERTYERKIKEAILAKKIEDNLTKQEILYLYLNQIFLGNRSYGIEAAAENYFHKTAKELNIAEAALIAGLAKAPSAYNPLTNFNEGKKRQEYIIDRMFEDGYISKEQQEHAKKIPLQLFEAPTDKEYNFRHAPWFVEEVRRQLIEKYGDDLVYRGGLKIYTTLDVKAQKAADQAVARGLSELHKRHGYLGPIKNIAPGEFEKFNADNHRRLYWDCSEQGTHQPLVTEEQIQRTPVKLKSDKIYQGLVTNVDGKAKTISVQVGQSTGLILPQDFGWARKRNNDSHGYNGVQYINSPTGTFSVGDIIEVKPIDMTSLSESQKKRYGAGSNYFSLEQTPAPEGALISYDPLSGYVKAVVGGKDYKKSEFNRATQAERQTGSAFKPLLYMSAIDKGYTPDTIILDAPLAIPDGPGRVWKPKNYGGDFKGPIPLRTALVLSRNVASVRIILDVGVDYVTAVLRKLGIDTQIDKVYSMALGANAMKLSELARAFGIFPNLGILPDQIWVKKITDRAGTIIEKNEPRVVKNFAKQIEDGELQSQNITGDITNVDDYLRKDLWTEAQKWVQSDRLDLTPQEKVVLYGTQLPEGYVMNPKTMQTMVDIMKDIVEHGTGTAVRVLDRPVAGKTGTTNDLTDCWFVGYTPNLVAGVWMGYDSVNTKVGGGETGGKAAAPVFLYYMQEYLKGTPVAEFTTFDSSQFAELNPSVQAFPGNLSDHFADSGVNSGSADYFVDDL